MYLKYSYRNQIKGVKWWISVVVIALVLVLGFHYYCGNIMYFNTIIIGWGGWALFIAIPMIYYHTRYWFLNRGLEMELLADRLVVIKRDKNRKEYLFSEIEEIYLHRSKAIEPGGDTFGDISTMDRYCCLKLEFKDWDEPPVYITCFMYPDMDEILKHFPSSIPVTRRFMF